VAHSGSEFQIGEYLIRRIRGGKFLIWNLDNEMMESAPANWSQHFRTFLTRSFDRLLAPPLTRPEQ